MQAGFMPGSPQTRTLDPALGSRYLQANEVARMDRVMTNSFGFGGTNCSLIFGWARVMQVFIEGVGVLGPGLPGWEASRGMLAGLQPLRPHPHRADGQPAAAAGGTPP